MDGLKNKRLEEEQKIEEGQKSLIRARSLADAYQVAYIEDDSAEFIMTKVDAAKSAGIQPRDLPEEYADYGIPKEPVEQRRGASITRPAPKKVSKDRQTKDIEIHTPEELVEHENTGKMKGWSGWFMDVKDEDGNIVDEVPAKSPKGVHGWIEGAKGIVQIVIVLLLAFMVLFPTIASALPVSSTDEAVLGNNRWKVTSNGNLIPISADTVDLGSSVTPINNIYVDTVNTAAISSTGNLTFQSSLLANGRKGASSTLASSSTSLGSTTLPYSYVIKSIGNNLVTESTALHDALPGQMVWFQIDAAGPSGTWTVTPDHSSFWNNIVFSAKGQVASLVFDAAYGYVVNSYSANVTLNVPSLPR